MRRCFENAVAEAEVDVVIVKDAAIVDSNAGVLDAVVVEEHIGASRNVRGRRVATDEVGVVVGPRSAVAAVKVVDSHRMSHFDWYRTQVLTIVDEPGTVACFVWEIEQEGSVGGVADYRIAASSFGRFGAAIMADDHQKSLNR